MNFLLSFIDSYCSSAHSWRDHNANPKFIDQLSLKQSVQYSYHVPLWNNVSNSQRVLTIAFCLSFSDYWLLDSLARYGRCHLAFSGPCFICLLVNHQSMF